MESAPAREETAARPSPAARVVGAVRGDVHALHLRFVLANALLFFCPRLCFNRLRVAVYRLCGIRIGARTMVLGSMTLSGIGPIQKRLEIGEDSQVTTPLFADLSERVRIGNNVAVGHHAMFVTTTHDMGLPWRRAGAMRYAPIVVEDGCWIGAQATILAGVTLGRGSVVAAGAVVASDVPPNTLVGGVPARPIRDLQEQSE